MRHLSAHPRGDQASGENKGRSRPMKPFSAPFSNQMEDGVFHLEPERYELQAAPVHHFELARRDFFKVFGGGIVVLLVLDEALAQESGGGRRRGGSGQRRPQELGAWLHIGESGRVTVFTGKAEVGQNIRTS